MNQADLADIQSLHTKCTCAKDKDERFKRPEMWKHAMNQITRSMYSSTGIGIPTPEPHLGAPLLCPYCQQQRFKVAFNTDPFGSNDVIHYRQQRSEHILFRIYHKIPLEFDDINMLRIDKGVFIAQQVRPIRYTDREDEDDLSTSWLDSLLNDTSSLPLEFDTQNTTHVTNFNSKDLTGLISMNTEEDPAIQIPLFGDFTPYTYTVGARYTVWNCNQLDYMIQGAIPLWCQTLLLFSIYTATPPIRSNETRYGLISFAPELPLTFKSLNKQQNPDHQENEPDILLWYERLAMDNVGNYAEEDSDAYWGANSRAVLDKLVYCHIPPDLAELVTSLGNTWAVNEGYLLH